MYLSAVSCSIHDGQLHISSGIRPNVVFARVRLDITSLNSCVNGTSFSNTYGYPYLRLKRSSNSRIVRRKGGNSELRHKIKITALASLRFGRNSVRTYGSWVSGE